MKKILKTLVLTVFMLAITAISSVVNAQVYNTFNYTVKSGDSLWRICEKYEVGVSELISVNPQIANPSMIYPNQVIKVPNLAEVKALEKAVITLVNQERAKQGLAPLRHNWQLSRVARYKSEDMRDKNYFSHTSPTYGSPFDMMKNFGIRYMSAGENIAMGQQTPAAVMSSWMNSPGHRSNILSRNFTEIGVGVAKSKSGTIYWTQQFIGR
jgi:uncharacterized YkwD family protein/spore coat assembly protein SafA